MNRNLCQLKDCFVALLLAMTLSFSGCGIIGHIDQLQTLGEFSRNQDEQHKIVAQSQTSYDALVAAIASGQIKNYPNQAAIRNNFGEPAAIKILEIDGKKQEQWIYRYAIPQKAKEKVYLNFDEQGTLIHYNQEKI